MSKKEKKRFKELLLKISNGSQNATSSSILAYHPIPPKHQMHGK